MKKPTKYHSKRTEVDGIKFASRLEAKRYGELKLLERAKKITGLAIQPRYPITVNGFLVCTYVADFTYWDMAKEKQIIEDCKGMQTQVYKLKAKLVYAALGKTITEVER